MNRYVKKLYAKVVMMKKRVFYLLLLFGSRFVAQGCSCLEPPPAAEALKGADAVFVGRVIAGRLEGESNRRFEFQVKEVLKGTIDTKVGVLTGLGPEDCGYDFDIGRDYLVYATKRGNDLATHLCTRTKRLLPSGKKEVDELKEQGKKP